MGDKRLSEKGIYDNVKQSWQAIMPHWPFALFRITVGCTHDIRDWWCCTFYRIAMI